MRFNRLSKPSSVASLLAFRSLRFEPRNASTALSVRSNEQGFLTSVRILMVLALIGYQPMAVALGVCSSYKNGQTVRVPVKGQPQQQSALVLDAGNVEVSLRILGSSSAAGRKVTMACESKDASDAAQERSPVVTTAPKKQARNEADASPSPQPQPRNACNDLYVGKPVGVTVGYYAFGPKRPLRAVIVGVGNGMASAKIIDDIYTSHYGQVAERSCNDF